MLYVIFREVNLLLFYWFENIGVTNLVIFIKHNLYNSLIIYNYPWLVYSLPNLLWFTGGLFIIDAIWEERDQRESFFWLLIFASIGIFSEIFQMVNLLKGTFDIFDLFPMLFILIIYILIKIHGNGKMYV